MYDLMSADYMLDMAVKSCFDTTGTIKTEMTMRVILWSMVKEGKKSKLHKVAAPAAQELKTVSFQLASCYDWDTRRMRLRKGDNPEIRPTMEDEVLLYNAGSADTLELEDTNMYQTDSRDRAADRDAEAYEGYKNFRTSEQIVADDALFQENPRLIKMRQGVGTYGYCAWCDAGMSNPTTLWNHYETVHSVNMQVAPFTPPSVWQTLLGREMGARTEHFAAPGRELKYWVTPAESNDWSSWIEGISRAYLVGVNEMNLTSEGHLPRVDIQAANSELRPFQVPPNAIKISLGKTEDYWRKAQLDRFLTLSIGTPITSDLAFMTMFNDKGKIEGGTRVLFQGLQPLDVLTCRVPHCSMPAPEAVQMKVTTAYMYSPKVAMAYLMASLDARQALGLAD